MLCIVDDGDVLIDDSDEQIDFSDMNNLKV